MSKDLWIYKVQVLLNEIMHFTLETSTNDTLNKWEFIAYDYIDNIDSKWLYDDKIVNNQTILSNIVYEIKKEYKRRKGE